MSILPAIFANRIEAKLKILNEKRPLSASAVHKLRQQLQLEMTYNSNAIEGNSLSQKETFLVINEGITIKGKPLKDHLEAKDQYEALGFLYELVDRKNKPTLSEIMIRQFHSLVVKKTEEEWAGRYRDGNVIIVGATHTPPDTTHVPILMKDLIEWYRKNQRKYHPVEQAAIFHHKLVHIHPFFDGNGRTARLIMNILLMNQGYPLTVILRNDRSKYYRALSEADDKNYKSIVRLIAQSVERTLDMYLKVLIPDYNQKFITLSRISKNTPYSGKYLNLLARLGKLEVHKEGRNWTTTKQAIENYIKNRERKRK